MCVCVCHRVVVFAFAPLRYGLLLRSTCNGILNLHCRLPFITISCHTTTGIKSFQLDDDNCYCHTTLDMGASMCGTGGDSNKGSVRAQGPTHSTLSSSCVC